MNTAQITSTKPAIIEEDPWLEPYHPEVTARITRYEKARRELEHAEGSLLNFANGHHYYGINFDKEKNGWVYREWAPQALQLSLIGDFNNWDRATHKLEKKLQRRLGNFSSL